MADKDTVRRAYDELVDVYAEERSENDRGMDLLDEFLRSLSDSASVLDAGCGQGTPVLSRLSDSATAIGLDFSRGQLRRAAENAPCASLVQGDMTAQPFPADAFDAVVAFWSLIHVPLDEHQTVIDECARVVRPGGRLLLCEGTNEWSGENPNWLESGVKMEWEIAGAKTTESQLQNAGFTIVDTWGAPEELGKDENENDDLDETADEHPWTFFSAQLDR